MTALCAQHWVLANRVIYARNFTALLIALEDQRLHNNTCPVCKARYAEIADLSKPNPDEIEGQDEQKENG